MSTKIKTDLHYINVKWLTRLYAINIVLNGNSYVDTHIIDSAWQLGNWATFNVSKGSISISIMGLNLQKMPRNVVLEVGDIKQ